MIQSESIQIYLNPSKHVTLKASWKRGIRPSTSSDAWARDRFFSVRVKNGMAPQE